MDCQKARAQLELRTLGSDAASGPDTPAAIRHLAECDACHLTHESQRQFDRDVANAMTDVPIPAGLADRLMASVGGSASCAPVPTGTTNGRRRSLRWLTISAVVALLPVLMWSLSPRRPMLNEASVRDLAVQWSDATSDSRVVDFKLPAGWSSLRAVQFGDSRFASVNGVDVPARSFVMRMERRQSTISGFVVRLSHGEWYETLGSTSFSAATVQYAAFGTWVVWREGDTVFICVMKDNAQAMQRLQDLIASSRGLS